MHIDPAPTLRFQNGDLRRGPDAAKRGQCPATAQLMSVQCLFAFTWLLAPVAACGATLDTYGELTGKTILAPFALPALPDSIVPELPPEKTKAGDVRVKAPL